MENPKLNTEFCLRHNARKLRWARICPPPPPTPHVSECVTYRDLRFLLLNTPKFTRFQKSWRRFGTCRAFVFNIICCVRRWCLNPLKPSNYYRSHRFKTKSAVSYTCTVFTNVFLIILTSGSHTSLYNIITDWFFYGKQDVFSVSYELNRYIKCTVI